MVLGRWWGWVGRGGHGGEEGRERKRDEEEEEERGKGNKLCEGNFGILDHFLPPRHHLTNGSDVKWTEGCIRRKT